MTLDFSLLIFGLLLLWFPRQWMRRGVAYLQRRRRSAESARIVEPWKDREPGDPRVQFRTEFGKFRNYLDLLRGAAGSLVMMGGMGIPPSIDVAEGAPRIAAYQVAGLAGGILLIGLLVQAVRYEKNRFSFYPPIFYLAGLSVGLTDIRGATFAFALIWTINPALPNAQAFLSVYALLMTLFGHFFTRSTDISAIYAGVLCFLPVLLSLLANRPLMVFTRKGSRGAR
jgi:hypothetical protein